MIGALNAKSREATVIGAGIAGMLAAHYLDARGYRVTLLEGKERAGGLICTSHTDHGIAESAAHSLIATEPVLDLCRDLGVELIQRRKDADAKYILRDGHLRRFPLSVLEAVAAAARATFVRSTNDNGQTLESWGRQHLGQPAVDYLLTPFVRGIYGVQPSELGVDAAFPGLKVPVGQTLMTALVKKRFQIKKSKTKNGKRQVAPKHGMGDLVTRLDRHLQVRLGSRFRKGEHVKSLPGSSNLLVATPAYAAASLLETESPSLARQLMTVSYTPIVSVTVFVDRHAFTRPVNGVGVLVPACEDRPSLGILFNSSSFDNRVTNDGLASFTVMMAGTSGEARLTADDESIENVVRQELRDLLGIEEPLDMVIHRWPAALPQYSPHLSGIWQQARETWCATPGRILFGNYTGQISLRGMIETAAQLS